MMRLSYGQAPFHPERWGIQPDSSPADIAEAARRVWPASPRLGLTLHLHNLRALFETLPVSSRKSRYGEATEAHLRALAVACELLPACEHRTFREHDTAGGAFDDHRTTRGYCLDCHAWLAVTAYASGRVEFTPLRESEIAHLNGLPGRVYSARVSEPLASYDVAPIVAPAPVDPSTFPPSTFPLLHEKSGVTVGAHFMSSLTLGNRVRA
jgi:hypothetical protein